MKKIPCSSGGGMPALKKLRLIMRLNLFLLLISVFPVAAGVNAQNAKLNLKMSKATIAEVFDAIEQKSDVYFFYNKQEIDDTQLVDVAFENKTIEEVLDYFEKNLSISSQFVGKNVIIKSQTSEFSVQQKRRITGKVTDASGQPLPGVTVLIKGTTDGTITDFDGNYAIAGVPAEGVLVFSFVGMRTEEILVAKNTLINVTMKEDAIGIEEVIAIGYGVTKKSDLTGAVSSVKADDLPLAANTSVQHMLSGKAAGLQVRQSDAQPGGALSILIRGAASTGAGNEPLYIIDGFPVSGGVDPGTSSRYAKGSRSPLNSINPNDIESIEVLKDASATAIYGARAANGVIVITTKSGKEGKVKVDYSFKQSVQTISRPWEMLNAEEYMVAVNSYRKERWMADNSIGVYGDTDPSSVEPWQPAYTEAEIAGAGAGTDWFKQVTQTGTIQEHNVSISGATDETNYLVSANYMDQGGVVKGNDFNRFGARINLDQQLRDWAKVGIRASGSRITIDNPALGTGRAENVGIITSALNFTPTLPVYDESGNYTYVPNSAFFPNPVSLLEITNFTTQDRLLVQGYAEIEPFKDFRIKSQVGFDKQEGVSRLYLPKTTLYGASVGGEATIKQANRLDNLFNTTISYTRELKKGHQLSALLGYEFQEFSWDGYGASNSKFTTDAFLYNNLGAGEAQKPDVSSYRGIDKLASYFGRLNYNIQDRYLFTFTMRADGSTKFGAGNKWGYFPSGAFAWRVINEDFVQDMDWLSNLKLRLSAGQTGNSNISGAFAYFGFGSNWIFGDKQSTGSILISYPNNDLKWETTTEYNLGLDFGVFDNRISGSLELFYKEVSDLLGTKQLKPFLERDEVAANLGVTSSKGYELTLTSINTQRKLKWSTTLNVSAYRDRWKERSPDVVLSAYQSETDPLRVHWGYLTDGLIQPGEEVPHMPGAIPGWLKVRDIDGFDENNNKTGKPDGIINDADIVKIADADPDFVFGVTNNFEYGNFDLNIHVYGMVGIRKSNDYLEWGQYAYEMNNGWNKATIVTEAWSSENQNGKYPNNVRRNPFPGGYQYLLQKADFIRVKNITLGYNIPRSFSGMKFFDSTRIFMDVANPFLITSFKGLDPEYGGIYPPQRTYTIGVNLKF